MITGKRRKCPVTFEIASHRHKIEEGEKEK
jgi:hypothetical protein